MMNITRRHFATTLFITFLALALLACDGVITPTPIRPVFIETPQPADAYAAAQATLVFGQNQSRELSQQATAVGLEMAQAADAAARSTLDENQRRMMELSNQATLVSQEMVQAAATQKFITKQTRMARNATAAAQSSAATATYSAYSLNVTQTAQIQAFLDDRATQNAQAITTQRAYAMTATPYAVIQAFLERTRNEAERHSLWEEFVVTPLKLILSTLVILLLVLGGVVAFRRLMPVLELRLRTISRGNGNRPLILLDGISRDPDPPHPHRGLPALEPRQANISRLTSVAMAQVEVIDPSDRYIAGWIAEAEQNLRDDGDDTQ
jgi:hypothetical protein